MASNLSSSLSYLDPVVLARISNLQVRARTVAEGFIAGLHHSPFKGQSLEFAQHREYATGDELKYIDWKIYARSDRFFVKQYEQETNLRLCLLVDASGSMGFRGEGSPFSKFDYAATLAASLSYLTLKQGDSVGIGTFNRAQSRMIPPRNHFSHLNVLLNELERSKPAGETSLAQSLNTLAHSLTKRSLVVLLSDLLDEEESVLKALKYFQFKKHEVLVLHLLDRWERDFPYKGSLRFDSLENDEKITLDAETFRRDYQEALQRLVDQYRTVLRKSGMEYFFHTTDEPLDRVLQFVLTHRV